MKPMSTFLANWPTRKLTARKQQPNEKACTRKCDLFIVFVESI